VLKLRRGLVVAEDPLTVEIDGERRPAWADEGLVGAVREGDEVIVNVAALDLGLGSGGFDVVHVNLTRGLQVTNVTDDHVMKLNYSSLQHPVDPVEAFDQGPEASAASSMPVLVIPLHGHLAPAAWAAARVGPDLRIGYVQTAGGALPGSLSKDVKALRERGLLAAHITAAPTYGGELEAISVAGALDAAARLGWDAAVAGPGPGIIGSDTRLGHGGLAALDTAHAALALGLPTIVSPRLSDSDARSRHAGVSHHTLTLLELLLAPVEVPVPPRSEIVAELTEAAAAGHRVHTTQDVHLREYASSGLPARVMGRGIEDDPVFFEAALAAGHRLGEVGRWGFGEPVG
jgi:Protein of unknown function (DUF3866)